MYEQGCQRFSFHLRNLICLFPFPFFRALFSFWPSLICVVVLWAFPYLLCELLGMWPSNHSCTKILTEYVLSVCKLSRTWQSKGYIGAFCVHYVNFWKCDHPTTITLLICVGLLRLAQIFLYSLLHKCASLIDLLSVPFRSSTLTRAWC